MCDATQSLRRILAHTTDCRTIHVTHTHTHTPTNTHTHTHVNASRRVTDMNQSHHK